MSSKIPVDLREPVRYTSCYRTGLPQRKGGNYGRSRKSAIHRTLRAAQSGGRAGRRVQQHSAPAHPAGEIRKKKGFENTIFLADDGYSGTNFERPSWKKIVEMIEAGQVANLIVKDASRLGREYLQVGYYMETLWTRTQKADHETGAADNK